MPSTSVRERIVESIKDVLEGMDTDTYAFKFDKGQVRREPFKNMSGGKRYSVAIFDDSDIRNPDTDPIVRISLKVVLEIIVYVQAKEAPSTQLNLVVSEVERALMVDRTLGNLAIDVTVDRTEHDIEGRFDKYAETTMFISVDFRHRNTDPREIV